ncbi:MAG TPA: V-type ATP synthase subunit I [Thermoplasmatales archaeon]|nr:V-type ATP synthase subunit I [Thermoplasmatales archaeon]
MNLFPEEINKVSVLVHSSDLERVIDTISEKGIIHITDIDSKGDLSKDPEIDGIISNIISYENRLKKILSILKPYRKKVSGIRAILSPPEIEKIKVKKKSIDELLDKTEKNLANFEQRILDIDSRLKSLDEGIKAKDSLISKLSNLQFLDFDLSYVKESEYIILRAGISRDLDLLRKKVEELGGIFDYRALGRGKDRRWIVVAIFHQTKREEADRLWQRYVEEIIEIPDISGKPSEIIKRLKKEIKSIEKEITELKKELRDIANKDMIKILANLEELTIEKVKLEAKKNFGKTEKVYLIEGWILKERIKEFLNLLERITNRRFTYTLSNPSGNPEEPPTYIKTGKITKPFKPLLTLFGLPKYREINPLIFITLWFPLMFGFMLGDAGYGLVILFGSLIALLKLGKISRMIRDWSIVGIFLGIWTIIFGYISNNFFGDLLPRFFGTDLPRVSIFGVTLPIDGLRNPLIFLEIALILGIIHLNIGLILGIYQDLKNNKIKDLICGKFSFILLQIFGGALIGECLLRIWELSPAFKNVSYIGALIGIVLLALEAKGMAFLELMGFVGDWLSYARLLALGLATAGMALAFNIVAQLFGDMMHVVVSIFILLIAHLATIGLNSLGAAVHSLRLQYVEFFNRFYEGGGKEFAPLKAKRKYTELV